MHSEIKQYNDEQTPDHKAVCDLLASEADHGLPEAESKIWHAHPVWFLDGNPIVGYSKQKSGIRLMFWSGADFSEPGLNILGKKFKDASAFFNTASEIDVDDLRRWFAKSIEMQWDYKNIVKRKGKLIRIGPSNR